MSAIIVRNFSKKVAKATPPKKIGYFKKAWNEMPEIVGSTFMAAIGIGLALMGVYRYYQKDLDHRRYKFKYTVIRHDDPKVKFVRDPCECD